MGRPVQMRVDYRSDAGFFLRFERAVALDTRQSADWRRKLMGLVHEAALLCMQADSGNLGLAEKSAKKKAG